MRLRDLVASVVSEAALRRQMQAKRERTLAEALEACRQKLKRSSVMFNYVPNRV